MKNTQAQKIFNAGVWQDKDATSRVRIATSQPVMVGDTPRTPPQNTKSTRVQNHPTRRKLRQVASWVDEPIIAQLQELARSQGLSMSQTIHDLLKEILRQRFHQQQAATLPSLIEKAGSVLILLGYNFKEAGD